MQRGDACTYRGPGLCCIWVGTPAHRQWQEAVLALAGDVLMRGTNSSWKKCGNNIACYREGSAGFLPARLVLSSESVQICSPGFQIASTYSQLLLSICLFPQLLQTLPRSWPLVVLLGFLHQCLCNAAQPACSSPLDIASPLASGPGPILVAPLEVCCIPAGSAGSCCCPFSRTKSSTTVHVRKIPFPCPRVGTVG